MKLILQNAAIKSGLTIGVLDIQGSVEEHLKALKKLGVFVLAVKSPDDLDRIQGLIIPGGESTVISPLMRSTGIFEALESRPDLPIWGTCAGAILLAKPMGLGLMDFEVERNAYGRQLHSFETSIQIRVLPRSHSFHAVFIRAPRFLGIGKGVRVLARHQGEPVMLSQGHYLATSFHPELTGDLRVHQFFCSMIREEA